VLFDFAAFLSFIKSQQNMYLPILNVSNPFEPVPFGKTQMGTQRSSAPIRLLYPLSFVTKKIELAGGSLFPCAILAPVKSPRMTSISFGSICKTELYYSDFAHAKRPPQQIVQDLLLNRVTHNKGKPGVAQRSQRTKPVIWPTSVARILAIDSSVILLR